MKIMLVSVIGLLTALGVVAQTPSDRAIRQCEDQPRNSQIAGVEAGALRLPSLIVLVMLPKVIDQHDVARLAIL
jgi:hypothetical protein